MLSIERAHVIPSTMVALKGRCHQQSAWKKLRRRQEIAFLQAAMYTKIIALTPADSAKKRIDSAEIRLLRAAGFLLWPLYSIYGY
jgi:hypothetical protein